MLGNRFLSDTLNKDPQSANSMGETAGHPETKPLA